MTDVVKPTPGPASPAAIPQAHMVVPNVQELPHEQEFDARGGGEISTAAFDTNETRPQELHGAVAYQEKFSTDKKPDFVAYTDLTKPRGVVRG